MARKQIFRTNAEDCLRLAETMKSPQLRAMLVNMAHAWHRMAQDYDMQGERLVPTALITFEASSTLNF